MKISKTLLPILMGSLVAASGCVGLISCNKPEPEPDPDPETTFIVSYGGDTLHYSYSNETASTDQNFVTVITPDSGWTILSIKVSSKTTVYKEGKEFSVDGNKITIFKEYLQSQNIRITVELEEEVKTFPVTFNEVGTVVPSTKKCVIGEDFETTFLVVDPSKDFASLIVQSDGTTLTQGVDYTITNNTIHVLSDAIVNNNLSINFTLTSIDPVNFIFNRSFSLMAFAVLTKQEQGEQKYATADYTYGTGWIIDDATPKVLDDYNYHVATNWHVTAAFDHISQDVFEGWTNLGTVYSYGDLSCAQSEHDDIIDSPNEYAWLTTSGYAQETEIDQFLYENKTNEGIDLFETDINFAAVSASQFDFANSDIKTKLDGINEYRKYHSYVNKFVLADDQAIQNKTKYIGGYPMKEWATDHNIFGGKWENHEIDWELDYWQNYPHQIKLPQVSDCSPQYVSSIDKGNQWMSGGASGSMLLTEDCEVCGIYWGGWTNEAETVFYPSFSLFNTTGKNFLDKYMEH